MDAQRTHLLGTARVAVEQLHRHGRLVLHQLQARERQSEWLQRLARDRETQRCSEGDGGVRVRVGEERGLAGCVMMQNAVDEQMKARVLVYSGSMMKTKREERTGDRGGSERPRRHSAAERGHHEAASEHCDQVCEQAFDGSRGRRKQDAENNKLAQIDATPHVATSQLIFSTLLR